MALNPTSSRGSGGGGGIASWGSAANATLVGSGSPVGVITPGGVGDLYVDNVAPGLWQANGLTNTSWTLIGLESGTSFPGSPVDQQFFYRSDRSQLYFWKASVSRWLTVTLTEWSFGQPSLIGSTTTATNNYGYYPITDDIYIEKWTATPFVQTTNNGTNFWTVALQKTTAANVPTNITAIDTSADTVATWTPHVVAVNALVLASGFAILQVNNTVKTSAPGPLFLTTKIQLRLAG